VLEKEIEKAGLPCTLITAMVPAAITVGANRIVRGNAIIYPLGDVSLSPEREKMYRRLLVAKALEVLAKKLDSGEVFEL
jgi:glycine reductase